MKLQTNIWLRGSGVSEGKIFRRIWKNRKELALGVTPDVLWTAVKRHAERNWRRSSLSGKLFFATTKPMHEKLFSRTEPTSEYLATSYHDDNLGVQGPARQQHSSDLRLIKVGRGKSNRYLHFTICCNLLLPFDTALNRVACDS
jgi:hypothetical protein